LIARSGALLGSPRLEDVLGAIVKLSIARSIVEMHGGTIHADSRGLNAGATFRVRLPLSLPVRAG
jgi:signal transduction histidine kinase